METTRHGTTFTPGRFDDLLRREPDRCHVMALVDELALGVSMEAFAGGLSAGVPEPQGATR